MIVILTRSGQRPPGVRAKIKCKPNPSLTGVLVYISGGHRSPRVKIKIKHNKIPLWNTDRDSITLTSLLLFKSY